MDLDAAEQCAHGITALSYFMHETARARLEEARERERRLRRSLATLQRLQEQQPSCEWVETQLSQARREVIEIEEARHEFYFHRQASQWTQLGDRVTGEFFAITGSRHSRARVRQLRRQDGLVATKLVEIRAIATDFYRELLTIEPPIEA